MTYRFRGLAAWVIAAIMVAAAPAVSAEELQGSTIESRVLVGFSAEPDAVAALLPDGWAPLTLPRGPLAGTNAILSLMDRHLIRDTEGNAADPSSGLASAVIAYGVKQGEAPRLFVVRVFEPEPVANTYGNAIPATITRLVDTFGSTVDGRGQVQEWTIATEAGSAVLKVEFAGVTLGWTEGAEAKPHSAADPDFYRIYRYDQMAGLIMNTGLGRQIDGSIEFTTDMPALDALAGADLIAAVTIPVYIRDIYLP